MNNTLSVNNGAVIFDGYTSMNRHGSADNTHDIFYANTLQIPRSLISVSNSGMNFKKSAFAPGAGRSHSLPTHCSVSINAIDDSLRTKAVNHEGRMPYRSKYAAMAAQKKQEKEIYYQYIRQECLDQVTNKHLTIRSAVMKYGVTRTRLMKWLKDCPAWTGTHDDSGLSAESLHKRILEVNSSLLAGRQGSNGPEVKAAETHRSAQDKSCADDRRQDPLPLPVLQHQAANGVMAQARQFWRPW